MTVQATGHAATPSTSSVSHQINASPNDPVL
jgi:hypothetical protein